MPGALLALALACAAFGAPPAAQAAAEESVHQEERSGLTPQGPTRGVSFAARLAAPVSARSRPGARGRRVARLVPYGAWNGGPVVLAITDVREVDGARWIRVRLPSRPNGATGWIPERVAEIERRRYRIEISRRTRRLTLRRDGRVVGRTRVVVGASATPTPAGSFAVLEIVRQPTDSSLGRWALHLTAHSSVLEDYGGGPGRVAIHGRRGALLSDPLGSARSHGCIRIPDAMLDRLRRVAAEGTPVRIT